MGRFKGIVGTSTAALVLTAGVAMAQGIVPDRSTIVTISAPVSVPGVVLPAGEYLFRLADSNTNRNIVQIYDKDRSKLFATLMAIPAQRNEARGDSVVTFSETPSSQPPALRFWYFAGEKGGNEFAYPKDQAIAIARMTHESVMAVDTTSTDAADMQKAELHRIEANSPEVTAQAPAEPQAAAAPAPAAPAAPIEPQTPAPAPAPAEAQPAPAPAAVTPAEPAAPAAPVAAEPQATATSGREAMPAPAGTSGAAAPAAADSELPKTAGELPMVTLLGFLALGAALGARALRRRMMV